ERMITSVEESARSLITRYRLREVFVAMDRLNKSIGRGDLRARDFWTQVVRAIHEYESSAESRQAAPSRFRKIAHRCRSRASGKRIMFAWPFSFQDQFGYRRAPPCAVLRAGMGDSFRWFPSLVDTLRLEPLR